MRKQYIKLNSNDNHLSLGNLFRIIKELSKNKSSALQTEIFCTLFGVSDINDTTVNNYCVGCRSIGSEYKQIFLNKQKRYRKSSLEFCDNIIGILSIIDSDIYVINDEKIEFINNSNSAKMLCQKLYNLAKNDKDLDIKFTMKLNTLVNRENIYEALVEELIFIVLYKKQPLYEEELKKEVIENILNNTSISSVSLKDYLELKLKEGINYDYSLKTLAQNGNAYANFEMGTNEFYGYFKGYPRYDEAFVYLKKAADLEHAGANYMIGRMLINKLIGTGSMSDLELGYEYLKKSYDLGNVAACNTIGIMYYKGIHPLEKNLSEALVYFKKASLNNYAYAFNNIGRIYEDEKNYDKAFDNYLKAANLGESWACNKVGEYYRKGIIVKDLKEAFNYYNKSLESNYRTTCYYAYYNLAKYFYQNGEYNIGVKQDLHKAIEYFDIAALHNIFEAKIDLFYLYVRLYIIENDETIYEKIKKQKVIIESDSKYNDEVCQMIEAELKKLKNGYKKINIECLKEVN